MKVKKFFYPKDDTMTFLIIMSWLGCDGLYLVNTPTDEEQEIFNTHNETNLSLQYYKLTWDKGESV